MSNFEDISSCVAKDTCPFNELNEHSFNFFEIMYLYYGKSGMRIATYREECYDLSNLQVAGEQHFPYFSR